VLNLSDAGQTALALRVAVNPDGDAVFTWVRSDGTNMRAQGRTLSAAGVLGSVLNLSDAGQDASDSEVAIDDSGNALFTWARPNAQARTLSAAGILGPVRGVSDVFGVDTPQVAFDAGGNAVFAWTEAGTFLVKARTFSTAGTFGTILTLSPTGSQYPQLAVDAGGDTAFAWNWYDGTINRPQGRTLSAAGVLGPLEDIASSDNANGAQVGVDVDGNALFVWEQYNNKGVDRIRARTLSAAGALGPTRNLSGNSSNAQSPRLAVDPTGDAVVGGCNSTEGPAKSRRARVPPQALLAPSRSPRKLTGLLPTQTQRWRATLTAMSSPFGYSRSQPTPESREQQGRESR
jgi:hypothetical protein